DLAAQHGGAKRHREGIAIHAQIDYCRPNGKRCRHLTHVGEELMHGERAAIAPSQHASWITSAQQRKRRRRHQARTVAHVSASRIVVGRAWPPSGPSSKPSSASPKWRAAAATFSTEKRCNIQALLVPAI